MAKEGAPSHTEARKFSRKEIDFDQHALPPGAARLILGVGKEDISKPQIEISQEQLDDVLNRDIKKHPLDTSIVSETSNKERGKVDSTIDAWVDGMVDFLTDRSKVNSDAAKILNRKFDLTLHTFLKTDSDHPKRLEALKNRVETQLWKRYLNVDGQGKPDMQLFIKDFVGQDPYWLVLQNIKTASSIFGIFGGEATVRQLEDNILAYAALNNSKPRSVERKNLIEEVKYLAKNAKEEFVSHFAEDATDREWSTRRAFREPRNYKEFIENGMIWSARVKEIKQDGFEQQFGEIMGRLSEEQQAATMDEIDHAMELMDKDENREQVMISLIDPANRDRNNEIVLRRFLLTRDSDNPKDVRIFELYPRPLPFSEEGKLVEFNGIKPDSEHTFRWYQKADAKPTKSEIETEFEKIDLLEKNREGVAKLKSEGWREVAELDNLDEKGIEEFNRLLQALQNGTDEQKKMFEDINQTIDSASQAEEPAFITLTEPDVEGHPGKERQFIRSSPNEMLEIHMSDADENLDQDKILSVQVGKDKSLLLYPPESPEVVDTELGPQPAPVESVSTEDIHQEVTNPAPVEENGGDIPSVNEELLNQEALPEDEKGINPLPNEEGGINPNESLEDSIQNQQIPDSEQIDSISPETTLENTNKSAVGEKLEENRSSGSDFRQDGPRRKGLGEEPSFGDEKTDNLNQSIQADQPLQESVASEQQIESRDVTNPGVFRDAFNQLLETHGFPAMSNIPVDQQRSEFERLLKLHGATDEEIPQLMERFDGLAGQGQGAIDDWNHNTAIGDAESEDLLARVRANSLRNNH